MNRIDLIAFNSLLALTLCLSSLTAQNTKTHTERFIVKDEVDIHVNTTHANVIFETWDKDEVEVTFTMEAEEKLEEHFEKWKYEATGNSSKVNIKTHSALYFDMPNYNFDLNMKDLNLDISDFSFEIADLQLENIGGMVEGILEGLNLEDMPESPFGEDINFNGDKYRKNPNSYLEKLNEKHGTNVTKAQADKWLDEMEEWADNIEVKIDESEIKKIELYGDQIAKKAEKLEKSAEKWEKENADKIEEMSERIAKQFEGVDWKNNYEFNFNQNNSKIKKTIRIKLPKKAKLHLNIRYGEVTLAENLRNINADLNYASLSAKTIRGKNTDISAAYAPVIVNHWENGRLDLKHCDEIAIKKINHIDLNAQGTDISIGTLFNSGSIRSSYGELEIKELGTNLKGLNLFLDYGEAVIYLPTNAVDLKYTGDPQSFLKLPKTFTVVSDKKRGQQRILNAYKQKVNSGKVLTVLANYGELSLK